MANGWWRTVMRLDVYHHFDDPDITGLTSRLDAIDSKLATLSGDIKTELDGILAGVLSPEMQAKVDLIFSKAKASSAKLDEALKQGE